MANERPALCENSDRMDWHVGGNLRYQLTQDHHVKLRVNYMDGQIGIPPSTQAPNPLHRKMSAARNVGLSFSHEGKIGRVELDEAVYVRLYHRLLKVFDDALLEQQDTLGSGNVWDHDTGAGGRIRGRTWVDGLPWGLTFVRVAAGVYHDRHEQAGAYNGDREPIPVERTILSLGPEAEAMLNPCWSLTVGIQLDLELPEELDKTLGWGPLVSALYAPLEGVAVRGTVARRARFPTLQERHSSFGGQRQPNPDLAMESAWYMGLEATWRLLPGIILRGGVQDAEVLDVITPESTGSGAGQERLVNATSARLVSVELGFTLSPFDQLRLAAVYSFLHARRTDEDARDVQLPYRPMNKASLELVFAPWRFVEMGTFLMVHGERTYPDPAGSGSPGVLSPYAIWNARIAVRPVTWGSVFVRATNILGTHHVTEYGFPDPGRRIWLGLDLNYDRS
jgi:outer membrane receptor protein involved in Fe transport